MDLKNLLPSFFKKNDDLEKLRCKINEAREYLADLIVEECEIRGYAREILEVVFERVGEFERKLDLLRLKLDFLRNQKKVNSEYSCEEETSWTEQTEKINNDYRRAYERAENRKRQGKQEIPERKKPRLKKLWMKLVKLFHPDKHMDNPEEKKVYEDVMATINQAKKDGDLEKLEEIALNPENFLNEAKKQTSASEEASGNQKPSAERNSIRNEKEELQKILDALLVEISEVQKDIKEIKKSPDISLWALWKEKPADFENAIREMVRELTNQITTMEKVIEKLEGKIKSNPRNKWAA